MGAQPRNYPFSIDCFEVGCVRWTFFRIASVAANRKIARRDFLFNPHFAVQSGNGFNPDEELLRVCETFSFLGKLSKPLAALSRSEAGFFH